MKSIRSMLSMLVLSGLAAVCLLTAAHFVEGRLAQQAVRQGMDAKDLTADILPPPMYLIELRLVLSVFRISAQAAAHPPAGGRAGPPERRPSPSRDADPAREPELAAA